MLLGNPKQNDNCRHRQKSRLNTAIEIATVQARYAIQYRGSVAPGPQLGTEISRRTVAEPLRCA